MAAYDQLLAEGYLKGHIGSGTFVSRELPDDLLSIPENAKGVSSTSGWTNTLSTRGERLASIQISTRLHPDRPRAFRMGLPDIESFPFRSWWRLLSRYWRNPSQALLEYPHPAGYKPLRSAISSYLRASRGVRCSEEQVLVANGSQQALNLTAQVLLNEGDVAWIEDPGYLGAWGALQGSGAQLVPVPIDSRGLDIQAGSAKSPRAKIVCVTPSRQYPLGVTMVLSRRLELLDWARQAEAWVVEDDYDSEYRYKGLPISALQGLDTDGRVIYIGTFSKVLFPSLRLAYLVVPRDPVDAFTAARALMDMGTSVMEQAALADFISEGHFARHIRRMRTSYAVRQATLIDAANRKLDGLMEVSPADAGMHLVGWLPAGVDDDKASQSIAAQGIDAQPLSAFSIEPLDRGGLLLGYTGVKEDEIRGAVRKMAQGLGRVV